MRLSKQEINIIKSAILTQDPNAKVFLFGSRVRDDSKGGDIDILVLSSLLTFKDKLIIRNAIFNQLEEQKFDLLIAKDTSDPFVNIAWKNAVEL